MPQITAVSESTKLSDLIEIVAEGNTAVPVIRNGNQLMSILYLNDATQAYEKKLLLNDVNSVADER